MKIELDFINKTITVKGTFKFSELEEKVKALGVEDWDIINNNQIEYYPYNPLTQPNQFYPWDNAPFYPQVFYTTSELKIGES